MFIACLWVLNNHGKLFEKQIYLHMLAHEHTCESDHFTVNSMISIATLKMKEIQLFETGGNIYFKHEVIHIHMNEQNIDNFVIYDATCNDK